MINYTQIKKDITNVRKHIHLLDRRRKDIAEDVLNELERLIDLQADEKELKGLLGKFDRITEDCEDALLWSTI